MEKERLTIEDKSEEKDDKTKYYSINTYMLPAKMSYFFNDARYKITDYLMLFYVSAGLSPSEAGLVNGLQYIGGIIGAPLWGLLADKVGYHRTITISLCIMAAIATCIQPYLVVTFGRKENNMCPSIAHNVSNISNYHSARESFSSHEGLFYYLLVSAIFAASFDGSIYSFTDTGVMLRVQSSPRETNLGMQRYAGAVGASIGSIAYSFSLNYFPRGDISCYIGLFVTYALCAISCACGACFLFKDVSVSTREKVNHENVVMCLMNHLKCFDTMFFLVTVLFNGMIQALMFSFIFLYLKELNAPTLLFGFSISVNSVSSVIVYIFSSKLINMFGGTMNAMGISCFAWALRFICTAFLTNPYAILAIDILQGFTYSLFRIASLLHLKATTEDKIFTTMCGINNSLYLSCSFLLANVIGGWLYEMFGPKKLYIYASIASVLWSVLILAYVLVKRFTRTHLTNSTPQTV